MYWYRFRQFVRGVLTSFWFWPLAFTGFAVYLSSALSNAARSLKPADVQALDPLARAAEVYAGVILTTTAAADVTILTFVFSTLMVVLQLASSQLSPRILRTTVREGRAQISMAIMVGGFVFSLYSLLELYGANEPLVPAVLVLVAIAWTALVVLAFLYFVGYTVSRIRAPAVIRSLGKETAGNLRRSYGWRVEPERRRTPDLPASVPVLGRRDGVVTGIGVQDLTRWARRRNALVELDVGLGDHVTAGVPIGRVWANRQLRAIGAVQRAVVIQPERSLRGDPPYGFRLLVDIANRALSPAVNDPTTAVQVIDELENLLVLLAERPEQPEQIYDRDGVLRVRMPTKTWRAYLLLAVQEIYEFGRESSQVTQRLARLLHDLEGVVTGDRCAAVRELRTKIEVVPPLITAEEPGSVSEAGYPPCGPATDTPSNSISSG